MSFGEKAANVVKDGFELFKRAAIFIFVMIVIILIIMLYFIDTPQMNYLGDIKNMLYLTFAAIPVGMFAKAWVENN